MASSSNERQEFDWDLPIGVPTIGFHRTLRVTSNESIGAVMIKLASKLGDADWSDFALWWPEKAIWLNKPRLTLYAYGIMADTKLEFVPVHRFITLELPNRHRYNIRVNFAVMTLFAVGEICQEFNIRHPEELSLLRSPDDKENYAKLTGWTKRRKQKNLVESREGTPSRDGDNISVSSGNILGNGSPPGSPSRRRKYPSLAMTPAKHAQQETGCNAMVKTHLGEPQDGGFFADKFYQTPLERCYINGLWLDSSKTLYEQEVKENDMLYLRFKYYCFLDIDQRYDEQRIIQLYEQAKHSILTEEVDCTEEEAYTFAALQLQVKQADTFTSFPAKSAPTASVDTSVTDIDAALNTLQVQLGQAETTATSETSPALKLTGDIKFSRPSRLTIRSPKKFFFVLKGNNLTYYKNEAEFKAMEPCIQKFVLTGAESLPDVDVGKKKFALNIILPSSDETGEIRLLFENSEEYSSWAAGCRMIMKGRPLAKAGYEQELASIKGFIAMQNKADTGVSAKACSDKDELRPEDLVGIRLLKKKKAKDIARHILEAHTSMLNLNVLDAKLQYIRNWQALQDFGITYFLVKVGRSRKEEFLGIAYNRLILMDIHTRDQKKIWRYSAMKSWNVNWESKQLRVDHEEEKLLFHCLSADLKVTHEFIGGNIWLSLRDSKDSLDVAMFVKLTGGVTNNLSGWGSETMARFLAA